MDNAKPYRFLVYERFAALAKEKGIRWVVLHGAEGYPDSIGRDLDCLCETPKDTDAAMDCFRQAALENGSTKWVVYPHPIWGHRCVAISEHFEAAELHILHGLYSGPISYRVNYDAVDTVPLFPAEEGAGYTKAILMPLLGNSPKVTKAIREYGEDKLPAYMQKAYANLQSKGRLSLADRMSIYQAHCGGPGRIAAALVYSVKNKFLRYIAKTVPVFYLPPELTQEELSNLQQSLQELFLESIDCTRLSHAAIYRLRASQNFLYLRRRKCFLHTIDVKQHRGKELCDFIVNAFEQQTPHF